MHTIFDHIRHPFPHLLEGTNEAFLFKNSSFSKFRNCLVIGHAMLNSLFTNFFGGRLLYKFSRFTEILRLQRNIYNSDDNFFYERY